MRRTWISLLIGLGAAGLALAMVFCVFSIATPGWLRNVLAGEGSEITFPNLVPTFAIPPTKPPETPQPVAPTAIPLPTSSNGVCGGPAEMTIALLGVDDRSGSYEKPTRTDSISLVNVRFETKEAAMLSIPRDLYVPLPNLEPALIFQERINTAFLYGEIYDVPGGGPQELKDTIALNFGIRVDRYVLINFAAFETAVDAVGGIDVDVPDAIYDIAYPLDDGLGTTIVFEMPAGPQHMDGETALRYARTRHQDDDYHRLERQQLVMLAIRDKLLSAQVITQIPALVSALGTLTQTDLSAGEIAALACVGPQIDRTAISAHVIDGTMIIPWTTPTGGSVSIPNREAIAPMVEEFLGQ